MSRSGRSTNQWEHCRRLPAEVRVPLRRYVANIISHNELTDSLLELVLHAAPCKLQEKIIQSATIGELGICKEIKRSGMTYIEEVVMAIGSCKKKDRRYMSRLRQIIENGFNRYAGKVEDITIRRLNHIRNLFALNNNETLLLQYLYCVSLSGYLKQFLRHDMDTLRQYVTVAAQAIGMPPRDMFKIVSNEGKLLRTGIIEPLETNPIALVDISTAIYQYICGVSDIPLADNFFKVEKHSAYNLKSCTVTPTDAAIIKDILSSGAPANFLLYGRAGTGKTEFARALCAQLGLRAYIVKYGKSEDRRMALSAAQCCAPEKDGVIIIDEADRLLNMGCWFIRDSKSPDKGWLNDFMDNNRHRMIWITNATGLIEESTMRRFAFSIKFNRATNSERRNIWKRLLKQSELETAISDQKIAEMSARYAINLGGIASAINSISTISGAGTSVTNPEQTLEAIVRSHATAVDALMPASNTVSLQHYDPAAININIDPARLASPMRSMREGISKCGIGMLFWGPPGTGKTALAQYLADSCGVELIQKRASDLISKWVGETEQNIADAFREADRTNAVLLIDEADSMLIDRTTAQRSWEVSQTNELLTQMETFSGVLICCTNMLDSLDAAALRRFAWKVKFGYLKPDAIISLIQRYFPEAASFSRHVSAQLTAMSNLTAGDIKAAWQRLSTIGENHTEENILQALRDELSVKKGIAGRIGF